ncbi:MAG: metallophosphoesterase [Anaerolineales bacterium]|nr:metallophosphoesterase [Anaerolineales bacterium]
MSNNGKRIFTREPIRYLISHLIWYGSHILNFFVPDNFIPLSSIEVTHLKCSLPYLEPAFDGYKIVHISDFHMGTWMNEARLAYIAELVNQQKPDLIAITGDFISYEAEAPLKEMEGPLQKLYAPDGIFAVLGNHDYYAGEQEKVRAWLRTVHITELRNDIFFLCRGDAILTLAGVDDCYDGADDLNQVIARVSSNGHERAATILLAHEPDLADRTAETGLFDLQLSGHSHGGQVVFPLLGMLYLPRLGRKYPRGMYDLNGMKLYTNRGLGTSHLRVRYNCPPEIAVLTLQVES